MIRANGQSIKLNEARNYVSFEWIIYTNLSATFFDDLTFYLEQKQVGTYKIHNKQLSYLKIIANDL